MNAKTELMASPLKEAHNHSCTKIFFLNEREKSAHTQTKYMNEINFITPGNSWKVPGTTVHRMYEHMNMTI